MNKSLEKKESLKKFELERIQSLAKRYVRDDAGNIKILRFDQAQRWEHQVLIVTFTVLAFTGLVQRYSLILWVDNLIYFLGGIEIIRSIHHFAAVAFIFEAIYHFVVIFQSTVFKRSPGNMWLSKKDLDDLFQMLRYFLNKTDTKPEFDRYTIEEKMEYWALIWGGTIMIFTGIIQWFPTQITKILPGVTIPIARTIHSWEAVLATLAIIIWHFYHTIIKERNLSIFTGYLSEHEMEENHSIELDKIKKAHSTYTKYKNDLSSSD